MWSGRSPRRPKVVSITLSDQPDRPEKTQSGKTRLSQLSAGQLMMSTRGERDGTRWTPPEGRPRRPSSITVDQLSITGMALVFNPGAFWLRRAIWLAIIVGLLVWLCLQLRLCVLRLSAGGTVRTWSRRTVTNIPLPAITVCHGNRFRKSVVLRHQPADEAGWPLWHQLGYSSLNWSSFDGLDQFYNEASYGWNDMVLFCKVGGRNCSDMGKLVTTPTLLNGRCTTLSINTTVTKRLASAQLTLVLREREPLGPLEHSGWNVFLHSPDVNFNDFSLLSGLTVSVKVYGNRLHEVETFRRVTEVLPDGEGAGCSTDSGALITYQRCLAACVLDGMSADSTPPNTAEGPRCSVPWIPRSAYRSPPPPCRTLQELETSSMGSHSRLDEASFLSWTSACRCAPPCRSDQYLIQSHEKWHAEETSLYLSHPAAQNATIGAVLLRISDVEELVTELEAYSWDSFIADVGGNLGLMLGGSLLTFVEIVDCAIATCMSRRSKRAREMC